MWVLKFSIMHLLLLKPQIKACKIKLSFGKNNVLYILFLVIICRQRNPCISLIIPSLIFQLDTISNIQVDIHKMNNLLIIEMKS